MESGLCMKTSFRYFGSIPRIMFFTRVGSGMSSFTLFAMFSIAKSYSRQDFFGFSFRVRSFHASSSRVMLDVPLIRKGFLSVLHVQSLFEFRSSVAVAA